MHYCISNTPIIVDIIGYQSIRSSVTRTNDSILNFSSRMPSKLDLFLPLMLFFIDFLIEWF